MTEPDGPPVAQHGEVKVWRCHGTTKAGLRCRNQGWINDPLYCMWHTACTCYRADPYLAASRLGARPCPTHDP